MQRHYLNHLSTFSLACAVFMQLGVVGLLVAQSFEPPVKLWILGVSACLLVVSCLSFVIHGLWR